MYYYIVDPQKITQQQFERVQNLLYSSLSDYRISGEVARVTGLRTIAQLVENAFAREVKTLVAVGSEETLHDVINATKGRDVAVGFIPLLDSEVGKILGMNDIEQASKIIAQRRIAEVDLGVINNTFFVTKLSFGLTQGAKRGFFPKLDHPEFELKFSADGQYQASLKIIGGEIINLTPTPADGMLDVTLVPKVSTWASLKNRNELRSQNYDNLPGASLLHVKKIEITSPAGLPLKAVGRVVARTPAVIEIVPKALKIIIDKNRTL